MSERLNVHLSALEDLLRESGLQIVERKAIPFGVQIVLTDGLSKVPLNIFTSGRISVQGKPSDLQAKLDAWAKQQEATFRGQAPEEERRSQVNILVVAPSRFYQVRNLLAALPGARFVPPRGSALFRAEIEREHQDVAVRLYPSGSLVIQGLASRLLDEITQTLSAYVVKPLDWRWWKAHRRRRMNATPSWKTVRPRPPWRGCRCTATRRCCGSPARPFSTPWSRRRNCAKPG